MTEITRPAHSILFRDPGDAAAAAHSAEPSSLCDLNLDQVLAAMTAGRGEHQLQHFFYTPLRDADAVRYRHQALRDLENEPVLAAVRAFAEKMRQMREHLAQARKLHSRRQRQRWFVDAVDIYCRAVSGLGGDLGGLEVRSSAFGGLRDYLATYTASEAFTSLVSATRKLYGDLATVSYSVHIRGNRVRVTTYDGEPDYGVQVEKTFAKFKRGEVKDYRAGFRESPDMNHVEAQILELVARLYPTVFGDLDDYCDRYEGYLDATVGAFYREVHFYLAYLEFIAPLRAAGLQFCYPHVSSGPGEMSADESFDVALASKLVADRTTVVCNGFTLAGQERIMVVTGPNQGGKTTFARMFGQVHCLAGLGFPVPGRRARLPLPDRVFTHFEREEDIAGLRGKLEDELTRVHEILRQATASSVLVMNESFTSTTLADALLLGTEVMRRIIDLDVPCVYVTFADELASLSESTVSMVASIAPENPAQRTYQIVRKPADGLAYAAAIAAKHGLTYERVKERIAP